MKYLLFICLAFLPLSASIYYAKVEPYDTYNIKATVSGEVTSVYNEAEGKVSKGRALIHIDDYLNKKELKSSKVKLQALKNTLFQTEKNIENAKTIESIRQNNYNRIKDLKTKPRVEKDNELVSLINAKNQLLTLQNSKENLKISISDLEYKVAMLEDTIENKTVSIKEGFFIYNIHVNKNDFVNVGTPLVDAHDISQGKLTIFLSKEDVKLAQDGVIYINDKATTYKTSKIWSVADEENISAYKAEILIPAPKRFSKLLKIEFKEE